MVPHVTEFFISQARQAAQVAGYKESMAEEIPHNLTSPHTLLCPATGHIENFLGLQLEVSTFQVLSTITHCIFRRSKDEPKRISRSWPPAMEALGVSDQPRTRRCREELPGLAARPQRPSLEALARPQWLDGQI